MSIYQGMGTEGYNLPNGRVRIEDDSAQPCFRPSHGSLSATSSLMRQVAGPTELANAQHTQTNDLP